MRLLLFILLIGLTTSSIQAQNTRFVYLTPVLGSGTEADPFHSGCLHLPGKGNIDLRPWGIDRFLCASDALPADTRGITELGSSLTASLDSSRRTALNTLAGKTLTATTVDGVIRELLTSRLRAGRDGKIKIYLGGRQPIYQRTAWVPFEDGGLVADASNAALNLIEPALAWAASISENWNCSDSGSLTCQLTWTEITGTNLSLVGNQVSGSVTNGTTRARADSALDSVNHEATVTITGMDLLSATFDGCGPIARMQSDSTISNYAFRAQLASSGELSQHGLRKWVATSISTLDDDTTDVSIPEDLTIVADGSSISGKLNGTTIAGPVTDEDVGTGNYTGITHATISDPANCTMDNFSAQDIVASSRRPGAPIWFQ